MRYPSLLALLLASALPARAAAPWNVAPCTTEHAQAWRQFSQQVRSARPGSPVYVPKPFPVNDQQVIEDFLHQHRDIWSDTPADQLRPEEKRFFAAIDSGRARFEVVRVVNWTPLRCGPKQQRPLYFVVRVFEPGTGTEVTRAALNDTGLLSRVRHRSVDHDFPPLADLQAATTKAQTQVRPTADSAQYVTTWGSLECDLLDPCVALRDGSDVLLKHKAGLYRISSQSPRLSFQRDVTAQRRPEIVKKLDQSGKKLVSLGQDVFTTATRIAPPQR